MIRKEVLSYFKPFVEDLPEIYQDIEIGGEVVWQGKRECASRWEAIKDKIKPNSVVLDLGSGTGYFAIRIAKEFPSVLVVSVECMGPEAALQQELLNYEELYNVVLLNHRLTLQDFQKWGACVEGIDLALALSVLHHFPPHTVLDILQILSRMVPEVIAEVPTPLESDVCGQAVVHILDPFGEIFKSYYPATISLGSFRSHLGDYERTIWYGKKIVSRGGVLAYWDCPNTIKRHSVNKVGGEWKVDQKDEYIPGVNVWSLLHLNPIWPLPEWWQKEARIAFDRIRGAYDYISDIRPWNMLMTVDGLTFFDVTDEFPKGDQAEFRLTDIDKLQKVFTLMKPVAWNEL